MERDFFDEAPCSSIAVDSVIRMGTAGVIWGSCVGPFDANKLGLTGITRASFVAKLVGQYGLQWGVFAAIFSFTHCGIQRYRGKKDWVNTFTAGVAAGAAFGAGTRNWKQVAGVTGLVCTLYHFADNSRSV
ncbi:Outer envelope pore protein 16-4 [Forsythia ovata]|uniref:Outer envelope pore protein 16-4 n=1 Tax=Forsythia ovata TaxID=205694 RepID=A0ABD1X4F7_9LAMI